MGRIRNTALTTSIFVLMFACGPDRERDQTSSDIQPASEVRAASALSPEMLDALKRQYPVLGEQPAPEPQPSDAANPERIPDRVRTAMPERALQVVSGDASFYADKFEGRRTASGIPFRQNQMVAAHRAFPFGTVLRVTNTRNDRSVNVRVVDRGPFGTSAKARKTILDLSKRAANELGYVAQGRTSVRVEVLEWGKGLPRT